MAHLGHFGVAVFVVFFLFDLVQIRLGVLLLKHSMGTRDEPPLERR